MGYRYINHLVDWLAKNAVATYLSRACTCGRDDSSDVKENVERSRISVQVINEKWSDPNTKKVT